MTGQKDRQSLLCRRGEGETGMMMMYLQLPAGFFYCTFNFLTSLITLHNRGNHPQVKGPEAVIKIRT